MAPEQQDRAPKQRSEDRAIEKAQPAGAGLRILVNLSRKDGGVEGVVSAEGSHPAARFSGRLELMALLDALWTRSHQQSTTYERGQ